MKRIILNGLLSVFVFIFLAELAGMMINPKKLPPPYNTSVPDNKFGWVPKSNYEFIGKMEDKANEEYDVHYTTVDNGFRLFGNPVDSNHKRVFFVGDSYTQSVEVSDDKVFYSVIRDSLPIDVYAYGMAGYGTYQEYLILDKYIDQINPDVVVLQMSNNDFIDNHYELEKAPGYKVGERRPFLNLEGKEIYEQVDILKPLARHSRFIDFMYQSIDHYKRKKLKEEDFKEYKIYLEGKDYSLFNDAFNVTDLIFKKLKTRISESTEVIVFSTSENQKNNQFLQEVVEQNGFYFHKCSSDSINLYSFKKQPIYSYDGFHFNEMGQNLLAKTLIEPIKDRIED